MSLSDHLSLEEWITAYVLYLIHGINFPNEFPMGVDLGSQLRGGIWLLDALGYKDWQGIEVVEGEVRWRRRVVDSGAPAFLEFLAKNIVLRDYWVQAIQWIEAQTFHADPDNVATVLEMLRDRLEMIVPDAKIGWSGKVAGFGGGPPVEDDASSAN